MYVDPDILGGLRQRLEDHREVALSNAASALHPQAFPSEKAARKRFTADFDREQQRADEVRAIIAWLKLAQKKSVSAATQTDE